MSIEKKLGLEFWIHVIRVQALVHMFCIGLNYGIHGMEYVVGAQELVKTIPKRVYFVAFCIYTPTRPVGTGYSLHYPSEFLHPNTSIVFSYTTLPKYKFNLAT